MSNYRSSDLDRLAAQFKALANPHRLRIFLRLILCCRPGQTCEIASEDDGEGACVGDLGAYLALAPSTVSFHIKELRQAGLIEMKRSGQRVECWIPAEVLESLSGFFSCCCTGEVADAIQLSGRNSTRS